jgi:mannan endo-1,4-beta-mannosidase
MIYYQGTDGKASSRVSIRVEAESGQFLGTTRSSRGTVTGFDQEGDRVVLSASARAGGAYDVRMRYASPYGDKGFDVRVNGTGISGMLRRTTGDGLATQMLGRATLKTGVNTVTIEKGWGYYEVDWLEFVPVTVVALRKPPVTLVNGKATPEARALMRSLVRLYGEKTLSGQYGLDEAEYVRRVTGDDALPAILGGDLMDYSPSRLARGANPKGTTETFLKNAQDSYLLTLTWHWNAPSGLLDKEYTNAQGKRINALWWRGFYTEATTFDVARALATPASEEYRLLLRDIDVIAAELKKLAAAKIPVLWRPLQKGRGSGGARKDRNHSKSCGDSCSTA